MIESSDVAKLVYSNSLIKDIHDFNIGKKKSLVIGDTAFDMPDTKIIGYHTHIMKDHEEIFPGKDDVMEMARSASPLGVVISVEASKYWPKMPFTAGYRHANNS